MKKFSSKICEQLKFYVYLYIDPRNDEVFYIGKGKGNRCFAHLNGKTDSNKVARIQELKKLGLEPIVELLKYGLTQDEAFLVEQTAIDLLDLDNLTNIVRGHGARFESRASIEQIVATLDAKPVTIDEAVILINISKLFRYGLSPIELYDITRCAWTVGKRNREAAKYAFSIYRGVVREVYAIQAWLPGNSTLRFNRSFIEKDDSRWEFVGRVADEKVRKSYIGKSVAHYQKPGSQNPIRYINCDS